uniref:Uncharacterized protein n=2 Tax=Caenorhabditis japonica TaxID=281687 RepID=A0A8R1ERD8_CAEJA
MKRNSIVTARMKTDRIGMVCKNNHSVFPAGTLKTEDAWFGRRLALWVESRSALFQSLKTHLFLIQIRVITYSALIAAPHHVPEGIAHY